MGRHETFLNQKGQGVAFTWVHDKKEGFFDFSLFLALKV